MQCCCCCCLCVCVCVVELCSLMVLLLLLLQRSGPYVSLMEVEVPTVCSSWMCKIPFCCLILLNYGLWIDAFLATLCRLPRRESIIHESGAPDRLNQVVRTVTEAPQRGWQTNPG